MSADDTEALIGGTSGGDEDRGDTIATATQLEGGEHDPPPPPPPPTPTRVFIQ